MNHHCSLTQYHDYCTLRPQSSQKYRGRCLTTGPILRPVRRAIVSGILSGKVWLSDLSSELKPLAASLADIANDDGSSIWPSIGYMVWRLGVSRSTVDRNLCILREMGILQVVNQGGGRGNTTEYCLVEEKLPKRPPWRNNPIMTQFDKPRHLEQETTSPEGINHVTAMTHDSSLSVSEPSEESKSENSNPEECTKCGTLGEHRCPGNLSQKQRDKRAGRKPGRFPVSRNRVSAHSFVTAADGTERPPRYERPAYKSFTPPPSVPEKLDDDYPDLKEILRRQNEGTL